MWRLPNRGRSDTGRYKVPLAMREALHWPYTDIEALTHRPRKGIFWPAKEVLASCPALMALYQQVIATLRGTPPASPCIDNGERIPKGERNATLASLAGSMRRRGASAEAIVAALQAENRLRCEPPLGDDEVQGIAASIARYRPVAGGHATVNGTHRHHSGAPYVWGTRYHLGGAYGR